MEREKNNYGGRKEAERKNRGGGVHGAESSTARVRMERHLGDASL